jgi:hypothetical protein
LTSGKNELLGDITEQEWINFMSEEFTKRATQKFGRLKYLDYWVQAKNETRGIETGICMLENEVGKEKKCQAQMEQKDLDEETKVFVLRNALSPKMVQELKEEMSEAHFMPYYAENETEGKSGRRIRIVSEEYTEFLVGKGYKTKRFGSTGIADAEKNLLSAMNEWLKMYAELFEKVLGIKVTMADQLQEVKDCVKNGGYQRHNDIAGLCCFCEGEIVGEKERHRPDYMVVLTYVLSNVEQKNTKVSWIAGDSGKKNYINTSTNDIHFQAIKCQTNFMHMIEATDWARKNCGDNDYRLVFSARATMHFQMDEESRLRRTIAHFFGKEDVMKEKDLPEVRKNYIFKNILEGRENEIELEFIGDNEDNKAKKKKGNKYKENENVTRENKKKRKNSEVSKGSGKKEGKKKWQRSCEDRQQ